MRKREREGERDSEKRERGGECVWEGETETDRQLDTETDRQTSVSQH